MAKLKKMLGNIDSQECIALMHLIETQSKSTLATWAIDYAKNNYLRIYEAVRSDDSRLHSAVLACEAYLNGSKQLKEIKPILKEAAQIARDTTDHPVAQAAARAVSTACAAVQTPTNALGFLFYGAAAVAYSTAGLEQTQQVYDQLASAELRKAFDSLQRVSVPEEPHPAKIRWNC